MKSSLVIIIPVYEELAAKQLFMDIAAEFESDCHLLVVDDGSLNDPVQKEWLTEAGLSGTVIHLNQNVGHQSAIAVGLNYCIEQLHAEQVVIMDADGEDKPMSIKTLLERLESSSAEIVVAHRGSRMESIKFKAFYAIYRAVFWLFVGKSIRFGNFMAMTTKAAQRLARDQSTWQHVAGTVLNSRMDIDHCSIDRGKRYSGKSKMNFVNLTLHGLRSIIVFSENVLVRITIFCTFFAALLIIGLGCMVLFKLAGMAIPGWFSTVTGILLLLLFQTVLTTLMVLMIDTNLRDQPDREIDYRSFVGKIVEVS